MISGTFRHDAGHGESRAAIGDTHRRTLLCLAGILFMLLALTPGKAQAQAKLLKVRGSLQHVHGANLPWITNNGGSNYGHDIGPNHFSGYGYNYVGSDMDAYFADIKNMHTNVVRVWLFENLEGLNFAADGSISGIDATFLSNLNDLITRANNHGLAIYLTLFNHDIGLQFGRVPQSGGAAVRNFFTDAGAQTALINNVIKPLAQQEQNKLGVFGIDLLNESNYAVSPYSGASFPSVTTWPQLHDWIYNLTQAIHGVSAPFQVSCSTDDASSFSNANIYNRYGGVGLNFYDYHNYSNSPSLFTLGSGGPYPSISLPVLLGEFGPSTQGNNTIQATAVDTFLNQSSYNNWAGALVWSYSTSGNGGLSINTGVGASGSTQFWKDAAWKVQWWGVNKFGL